VHVDAYRLGTLDDLESIDLDASFDESVTVVEWGAGVVEQLSSEHLLVRLERRDDDTRVISLVPHGSGWEQRLTS
jgi:tRNA threonylcarbamoyladenosine biosynthesis protein TsaE